MKYKDVKESVSPRISRWRKQPVVKRVARPTRADRARTLGYKAKQGFVIVRTRIKKGGRRRPTPMQGRKPRKMGLFYTPVMNKKAIAEKRVARKFPNMEVLNSYIVAEDGKYKYYEVIIVDKSHPSVKKDKERNWIVTQRRRAFRGLTSSGKKSRK